MEERTLVFTVDELKALQYWFSMAAKAIYVTGFEWDVVDDSALIKIQEALETK